MKVFSARGKKPEQGARRRAAVIDIGSNSVRLVVYEGPRRIPAVIFNEKVAAGLGRGLTVDGRIADADAERGLTALRRFATLARSMAVDELQCVATAAVRDAANGPDFVARAAAEGLEIRLLSGDEEARAAGLGVLSAIPDAHGIAVDLGGGSLELAEVTKGNVGRTISFPLGVLRLPALRTDGVAAFERTIRTMLKEAGWPGPARGQPLYLVGGSWRALARLDMELTRLPLPVMDHHDLPRAAVRRLSRAVARMSVEELRAIPGMSTARALAMPDAVALLSALTAIIDAPAMTISSSGLREGLLFSALSNDVRAQDPLLVAAEYEGRRLARFAAHGRVVDAWIAPLFADDDDETRRLRLAACLLSDVAWSANPDFRAERGAEIALHGNWRGVDVAGRVVLAQALHTGFGGGEHDFARLMGEAGQPRLDRAHQWGLAIRLAQRLSGGLEAPLTGTKLSIVGQKLRLELGPDWTMLAGEAVSRRVRNLASALELQSEIVC
jgi:exopolyphosphatase / guanosine-5'-triphosphate,3'-diphosphate pyrophosphatase